MAVFKCKMCGGSLNISDGVVVATCEYCGTKQTVPKSRDEVVTNLFNRANNLRLKCEFDKAEQVYEKILDIDNTDAEAHWGIVLCKYGIEYVEDPKTYSRIPTCHRTLYEAVMTDINYLSAIENADEEQKELYIAAAKVIDELQKNILNIVNGEEPFDVFICYKETDENGKRTVDSAIANDIYYQLTQEGFKVFYAPITLEDKLGHEYEPYIFAALNSAKAMLVVGTKPEYFDSVWVRNEWSRFFKSMKNDRSKLLIPCYRDMDVYELPDEFAHLQSQDMGKIGFISDVIRGLKKVFNRDEQPRNTVRKKKEKKPSKLKKAIEKIKMKRREKKRFCLKLPLHSFCIALFIINLFLSTFFICYDPDIMLDMDCYITPIFIVLGLIVPLLTLLRAIKNKWLSIFLQVGVLVLSAYAVLCDFDNMAVEICFEGAINVLLQLIWLVLICCSKKTEKANMKKLNKVNVFLPSVTVAVSLCIILGIGGMNFCEYQLANALYDYGQYINARLLYDSLDDYKDSKELVKASLYNQAVDWVEKYNDYDDYDYAIEILEGISGYKDSDYIINTYRYKQAEILYKEKSYAMAKEILFELGEFEGAKSLLEEIESEIKKIAAEKISANNYIECTVTQLYKNPWNYNGKKIKVSSWMAVSEYEEPRSYANYYDLLLCDDLTYYHDDFNNGLLQMPVYKYYNKCIEPFNVPYVGVRIFDQNVYTDLPSWKNKMTIYGTFTYNPSYSEGGRYITDPHPYNIDADFYM